MKLRSLMLSAIVALPGAVVAAEAPSSRDWGTTKAPSRAAAATAPRALASIPAAASFANARYGTGGVGLRNRGGGSIEVSTVTGPVKAAYLYWAVISTGTPPAASGKPSISRRLPTVSGAVGLTGTVIGTGASPCWPGNLITVFKASVASSVANGAGTYEVRFPAGAGGSTAGGDPWVVTPTLPLLEGASLVVIGPAADGTSVAVYDQGLAGATFSSSLSYSLPLPKTANGQLAIIDFIGADGQHGFGRPADSNAANEVTRINGTAIAGSGSAYRDSDWNGGAGGPLPELWDTTSHVVTSLVKSGATKLDVSFTAQGDCLTPVANVVRVR
ncbi:MAG TPA: hypothetical protein PKA13_17010 [Geminicoccaceae bacterium]|nr:hypothetical protein [Geminicoccus sp.]HMU51478.1 hypothetical protein [Geminicoccaceae bacterium]